MQQRISEKPVGRNRASRRPARRRIPIRMRLAAAIAVVLALTGGTYAWAMMYYPVDYGWYNKGLASGEYRVATQGELTALATIVNGTWQSEEVESGHVALSDAAKARLQGSAGAADDFAGSTVYLQATLGFAGKDGAALMDRPTTTPIGTQDHPFNGTFDGQGNTIVGLKISNLEEDNFQGNEEYGPDPVPPLQYTGLFGHVGPQGAVRNLTLGRDCSVALAGTQPDDHIAYVGSVVGYCQGTLQNVTSQASIRVTWDDGQGGDTRCDDGYANVYVIDGVGGIAGYCDGDVTGAVFKGNVSVTTPANASWVAEADTNQAVVARYIGGIVGRSGGDPNGAGVASGAYGALTACQNAGNVTVATSGAGGTDRFGETVDSKSQYVGGIAGYAIGNITDCANSGDITATSHAYDPDLSNAQNLSQHRAADGGAESCGGIVGGFRSQGAGGTLGRTLEGPAADDAYAYGGVKVDRGIAGGGQDVVQIVNCVNTGAVMACNNVGGIAGATGTYTRVYRCANGDAKLYAQDDEVGHVTSVRWNKPNTGGLVGRCYGDIAYSRNHGEVETTKGGYYVGGLAGDLYYYRDSSSQKIVTPEVYACYNTGQVVCSKIYRRGALLGGNGGYIHDCLFLYGTSSTAEDEGIFAIGQEKGEDNPLKANLGIAYASDSQAASHGADAFSLKSSQAVAWLNNSAMCTDKLTGQTGWDSEVYYMATTAANRGYPVLFAEGVASTTRIDLAALDPSVELVEDAHFTTAYNPTPKLRVAITVNGTQQELVENADYYVVPDPNALMDGVCKGTTNGQRIYTAQLKGIGNYESQPFGSVPYAIGQGEFAECSISAVTDTFTNEQQQPKVTVLDPAGGEVDPATYDIVVNEGQPCIAPGNYAVMATAKPNSNYAGHCSGTYAIAKIDIARDCDVIGVVYDEADHGGVAEDLADAESVPRVWLYDDESYRIYEAIPLLDASGNLQTYTADDIAAQDGLAIPGDAPDAVAQGLVGYPKLQGFELYHEEDGDRWLTRATPAHTDAKGATVYGMQLQYTAGELRPDVIGVNWAQGKLQFQGSDGIDVPWRLIFGGGSGGSTLSREQSRAAEGTLNIESSATGAVTVVRRDLGFGQYLTNYDVITFSIAQAQVAASEVNVNQEGAKTVYKEGELVKAPELTLRYKGNVVDKANYALTVDRVTDSAGHEVPRRSAYLEGDTIYYKVTLKGSLSCEEPIVQDSAGNQIACYIVKDQTALTADRFNVVFTGGWDAITDESSVDKWVKRFTLDEGIGVPGVEVYDTLADGGSKKLAFGRDYKLAFSYEYKTGGWQLGGPSPNVQVIGMNGYAGTIQVRYRNAKGLLTQGDLDKMATGAYRNSEGKVSAKIAGVDGWRSSDGRNALQTVDSWMPQFGLYVAYRPHGYTADELAGRIGIGFSTATSWGCGYDAELFDVAKIEKNGVTVQKATEVGMYSVTLVPREKDWGAYHFANVEGSLFFDVEKGTSVTVDLQVVAPNLTVGDWNSYEDGGIRARVSMMDYSSVRLRLVDPLSYMFAYSNTVYPYTGSPVKPLYILRDNDTNSNSLFRLAGSREDGLETDEEVLARLREHLFDYDDYEVTVEGFESVGGCPTDVGEAYQVLALSGSANNRLSGRYDLIDLVLAENTYSIVAADISDPSTVGIAVGTAEKPNDVSSNVGYIGINGAEPEVRFYVDSNGNGTFDPEEQCAYVEGVDYQVEYLNNQDTTEGADATARIWVKDVRHLSAKANGTYAPLRGWYFDVPFRVEGEAVYLNNADVIWDLSETLVANADGSLSSPAGVATYRLGEAGSQVARMVPEGAYSLKIGTLEGGAFTEKATGWAAGDAVQIAVESLNPAGRFKLDEASSAVVGQATVVAASDENDFSAASSKLEVSAASDGLVYSGAAQQPPVTVTVQDADAALVEGVDYRLSYADNVNAGNQTAKVTVTGVGAYTGSRELSFSIGKLDLSQCTISCDDMSYVGAQIKPTGDAVHVSAGEIELAASSAGWEIDAGGYGANVNAGEGTLTVRAVQDGNLTGSKVVAFSIAGRSLADCAIPAYREQQAASPERGRLLTVDQFNHNGGVAIADELLARNLVIGQDFTVVGVANADGFANGNDDSATGSVRYLGYATLTVRGIGNYAGVATVDVPLVPKDLTNATVEFAEGAGGPYAYTGDPIKPGVVVKVGEEILEADVDYRVSYGANSDAGTATATVVGAGVYTGSTAATQLEFQIQPVQVAVSNASFALTVDELAYTGSAAEVSGVLTLRGERIAAGNVEFAYALLDEDSNEIPLESAPTEPGAYRVTATATAGSLLGSARADFTIVPASLSTCSLKVGRAEYAFGQQVEPQVLIVSPAKAEIDPAQVGCTVSYEAAGSTWNLGDKAFATVTASDDSRYFTGALSQDYQVGRILIGRADVAFQEDAQLEYTGSPVKPEITIAVGGRALVKDVDYTVVSLSDDLTSLGGKTLEITTPDTSVYEASNVLVGYEVVEKATDTSGGESDGSGGAVQPGEPSKGGETGKIGNADADTPTGSLVAVGTGAVSKKANTLTASAKKKTVKIKYSKVKKKKQTVKNLKVSKGVGKVTYKNVSTQKRAKKFKVNSKGVVTVPKKTKKGTYTIKVRVTAAGDAVHLSKTKTVTFKVKVV